MFGNIYLTLMRIMVLSISSQISRENKKDLFSIFIARAEKVIVSYTNLDKTDANVLNPTV